MRPSEEQRAIVIGWIEKWRPRLFLHHHRIEPLWRAKPCRDDDEENIHRARCIFGDLGLIAEIEVFPEFWKLDQERQQRQTVHELLHIVAPEATETEINHLTEILWTAYECSVVISVSPPP